MFRVPLVMIVLTWLAWPGASGDGVALRLNKVEKGWAIATPYVAPEIQFQVLGGAPKGYVYGCKQTVEHRKRDDHVDDIIVLECAEDVKLELKGIQLK